MKKADHCCSFCKTKIFLIGEFVRSSEPVFFYICEKCFIKIIGYDFIENYKQDDHTCQYCKELTNNDFMLFILYFVKNKNFNIHRKCFNKIYYSFTTVTQ